LTLNVFLVHLFMKLTYYKLMWISFYFLYRLMIVLSIGQNVG
jgi:hypothetical protein